MFDLSPSAKAAECNGDSIMHESLSLALCRLFELNDDLRNLFLRTGSLMNFYRNTSYFFPSRRSPIHSFFK